MRVHVTLPNGGEKRATVRTWDELHRVLGTQDGKPIDVEVVPRGATFHIIIRSA